MHKDTNKGKNIVTVEINGDPKEIHRGNYKTPDLKEALGVNQNYVIDQLLNGELTEIEDNSRIVIKGGESFVSHVRSGSSS